MAVSCEGGAALNLWVRLCKERSGDQRSCAETFNRNAGMRTCQGGMTMALLGRVRQPMAVSCEGGAARNIIEVERGNSSEG